MRFSWQRTLTGERGEHQGRVEGDAHTGGIRDPSPNKSHLVPTGKAKGKEKAGGCRYLPWKSGKVPQACLEHEEILLALSWHARSAGRRKRH